MKIRALFTQCTLDYWLRVATELKDTYGWEICYLTGSKVEHRAKREFPGVPFHTINQILKNEVPKEASEIPLKPIDKTLIQAMSFHESIFMKMMNRFDIDGKFDYHKRLYYYHNQLAYWKSILDFYRPDVVVFRVTPHRGYDYLLYALAQYCRIKTILIERTAIPGYLFAVSSFETGSRELKDHYDNMGSTREEGPVALSESTRSYLERLQQSYDRGAPFHLRFKLRNQSYTLFHVFWFFLKDLVKWGYARRFEKDFIRRSAYKSLGQVRKRRLKRYSDRLSVRADLTQPYVFVALQCEPERQTCPSGGVFGSQYLMIDMLSRLVPEGWKIYVKEHISQFKSYQNAERARTRDFYRFILRRPNVRLVSLKHTSYELIDRAMASATVSGTVAWESVVRGKPALLFGHSWYGGCEGVFEAGTSEGCSKALQAIAGGYRVDAARVERFAKAVEEIGTLGYNDKVYEKMDLISPEENVKHQASMIHRFYPRA